MIETAVGCDRLVLAIMCDVYREETLAADDTRVVMAFRPELAPVEIGVLPLSKKEPLQELAERIRHDLALHYDVEYDESGSIGKRYRRQDEIGTPYCVTVDFESLNDQKVTVRHRDRMSQDRVALDQLRAYISEGFASWGKA